MNDELKPPTPEAERGEESRSQYRPVNVNVWCLQLARATVSVLTKRLGPEFARDVQHELRCQAERYEMGDEYDRADAPFIRELVESPMWDQLTSTL